MTKKPKISIITACYNAEKTIEQTIQSVINQTYDNIEYIIVDGASTDGTMEIVNRYEDQIDIIISEPDEGIYDAFNKGARVASGDYVQYLNADDYLIENDVIGKIVNEIIINNYPVVIFGGIMRINEVTGFVNITNEKINIEDKMIPHPATFVKRVNLIEVGGFDIKYNIAADYDLICKLYKKYSDSFIHKSILITVFRLGGLSSDIRNRKQVNSEVKSIAEKHFSKSLSEIYTFSNEFYLKKWLEQLIFLNKDLSTPLYEKGIKRIVIWGSGQFANLLAYELSKKIRVTSFIDNDIKRQGIYMNNIEVRDPSWLVSNHLNVDGIVFGFEGPHDEAVIQQVQEMGILNQVDIYHWKDLISYM